MKNSIEKMKEIQATLLQEAHKMKEFGLELTEETFEILDAELSNQDLVDNFERTNLTSKSEVVATIAQSWGNDFPTRKYLKSIK